MYVCWSEHKNQVVKLKDRIEKSVNWFDFSKKIDWFG